MNRKQKIIEIVNSGKTYKEVGEAFGISKKRVSQIYRGVKRDWNQQGICFLREKVRARDSHTCQICKRVWKIGKRRFDVHHINESEEGNKGREYKLNKDMSKMITLCHKCHLRLPHLREKFIKLHPKAVFNSYPQSERNLKIISMRENRYKLREIAELFNISYQRVEQILERNRIREDEKLCSA